MSEGFIHSVKVPRFYKVTAKTVQSVQEEGASIKQLIYEKKHPNLRGTYGLALTTIQHGPQLDQLLRKTELLIKESRLDPWLARVLIAELLWGKKSLPTEAKPIKTILSYEKILLEELKNVKISDGNVNDKKVQKPRYVRVNTLVTSVEYTIRSFTDNGWTLLPKSRNYSAYLKALANMGEWMFIQDFHIPELFAFPPRTLFHNHPGYQSGAIVLQDKASCLPAYLLNAVPGSTVLDMCSAPGMKTTHLAAIMKNTGKIIAVERDNRRYKTLCEMIKTNHANCVTTINADAMNLDPAQCSDVEYILVDPSCSGSGMLDRLSLGHEASKCAPGRLTSLQSFQVLLLRHALLNFPKAKRIVYSTCSMYPEENEMVIDEILENVGDAYNLVPVTKLIGSDWKNFSSTDYKCKDKCLYSRPDIDMSNGFFVAVFERNFDVPLPEYQRKIVLLKRKNNDEKQFGNKKRRRKSKINGAVENGGIKRTEDIVDETQIKKELKSVAEEKMDQEGQKKPKKKQRKEITENLHAEEHTEVQSAIIEEDAEITKKKKKRDDEAENFEEMNGTSEFLSVEELKSKKTKKKKKKKENSDLEILEVVQKIEISDDQKIKKKKKKHSDLEILEVVPKIEISDEQKSKKNENKHLYSEIVECVSEVETSDELKSKKKKKNHSDLEILEIIPKIEISDEQKSKKNKNKHLYTEIVEDVSEVKTSDELKSKKEKKKHSDLQVLKIVSDVQISYEMKSKKKKKIEKDNAES